MAVTHAVRPLSQLAGIPVTELADVGPKRAKAFASLGVESVLDLLWHVPRRYIDRSTQVPISELGTTHLNEGEEATIIATVSRISQRKVPRRRLTVFDLTITDDTGQLKASWFNQPGRLRGVTEGGDVVVSGKISFFKGRPKLDVTALEPLGRHGEETSSVVPVHPSASGLTPQFVRQVVREALDRCGEIVDPVPAGLIERERFVSRTQAFRDVHFPETIADAMRARARLVYDELFLLEAGLAVRKRAAAQEHSGFVHKVRGPLWGELDGRLPYTLTGAQERALADIGTDLESDAPMHRLLQGEVGSGKTVIAAHALLAAVDSGRQGALMAPTEVLAEQHFDSLSELLGGLSVTADDNLLGERPLEIALLTNRVTGAERTRVLEACASGDVDIIVGTHALVQEGVKISGLGVAVIDEQHRFGVHQRVALRDANGTDDNPEPAQTPDVLIMTATPIPRTLSMTLYGDLDVTILDELPPGRRPIETVIVGPSVEGRHRAYEHARSEVAAGRQCYLICPLVDDSDQVQAKSASAEFERLAANELEGLRLGLLHGQLKSDEKRRVMDAFRSGDIDVLVATTVVEVGVDVANASLMIIEDADRFGLSQLHQLRGRIGRGSAASTCYLFCNPQTPDAEARMAAMDDFSDGFRLAERDLEIRGEGSLFDVRQSGATDLHVARLVRDFAVVETARKDAFALVDADPRLADSEHLQLRNEVALIVGDDVEWLQRS